MDKRETNLPRLLMQTADCGAQSKRDHHPRLKAAIHIYWRTKAVHEEGIPHSSLVILS